MVAEQSPSDEEVEERDGGWDGRCCCSRSSPSRFTFHHLVAFLITFFSYALLHSSRKTFSNVKATVIAEWTPTSFNISEAGLAPDLTTWNKHELFDDEKEAEKFLGVLDSVFMFSYAVGLFISGMLGDRMDPRIVLSVGMLLTALMNIIFGCVTEWLQFYSKPFYVCIWLLNGLAQSSGWPAEVCIMGKWFSKDGRGFVFGVWSSCASVGNIIGAELASVVLPYGYEYTFLVNSSLLAAGALIVFFGTVSSPKDLGIEQEETEDLTGSQSHSSLVRAIVAGDKEEEEKEEVKAISLKSALLLPGVLAYSLAYGCLKMVNYSFFFWLPFYLTNNFGWQEETSDGVSTFYDWGGIIGGVLAGAVSDLLGKRTPVVYIQLILTTVFLLVYSRSSDDLTVNSCIMFALGFFCSGAANMISAAVSADLGTQKEIQGDDKALSTVTGIVDGVGSIGAAFGQLLVPVIQTEFGWMAVFYLFVAMCLCTLLCLTKLCITEVKQMLAQGGLRLHQS